MINYDLLVDSTLESGNSTYLNKLIGIGEENTFALLMAQDVKTSYDFNGSGFYRIGNL
ncbi:hypothetical protein [Paraflavitalea speifideaquila]|uniref:hypothetical protein n=1 Tax=Paraflavitalea speifideaquila TaxID=3076558 RepID=UPI0028F0F058|nr:hypothetical protein [Paraflavitalea speifideiaquila]